MIRRALVLGILSLVAISSGLVVIGCGGDEKKEEAAPTAPAADKGLGILGIVPNAPPRATPTPPPPGFTPAPRPPVPEAKTVQLFMYVDTITAGPGESKYNVDATLYCTRSSVFKRGMHIVWRMNVVDTSTGKVLQTADVKEAVLKLPNGETKSFGFGAHGGTTIEYYFWTAAWDVPPDHPLGVIDFEITVTTVDGKTGTFKQLPVSNPAAGIESRLQILG